ncbi:hypothetical protein [Chitinophaga pinensis]|uniref:Uncharacterized protein n=1 Tax=Chitinophaga pinensis (strain ATCC 43595 / DSM 2588 / LMG 13176 / NBRC 15968 / NCIMB 11800 / UQM 2034) TaxID=485918 RepID=A0A979G734_CHIPD|nr:hypothetical protein [Chitinophaga pinensis]ACU61951.1 hypothetical protein Cpin_4509 [Chitinophaga pinensis DSM 2588]
MPDVHTIRIPLSNTRLLLVLVLCSISLLLIGFSLTQNDSSFLPIAIIYLKNMGVLLFGTSALLVVVRLFRPTYGLFITAAGITDKSSLAGSAPIR